MKVGIVGCGRIARIHLSLLKKVKGTDVVGVCDRDLDRAQHIAKEFGVEQFFTDFEKMLYETRPGAVHVLTPTQMHAMHSIQALQASCHVLVEKPLCLTLEQADAIYRMAQSTGRMVSVNHTLLWSPLVKKAKQVLDSGELGRIIHIQYVMGDDYLEVVKRGYARWALELRSGIFFDLIPHPLSLIRAFLPDSRVASARACGTEINDLRELWVDFAGESARASLWMSLKQRPLEHNLRLYCERGTVHIDLRNFCLAVIPERGLPGPVARVVNTISEPAQRVAGMVWNILGMPLGRLDAKTGMLGAIHAFYRAIAQGQPSPISKDDARAVVKLSTLIWDTLEDTPGAIQPVLDGSRRQVPRKREADFTLFNRSNPPNVLVTGGTGFIGSHLIQRLVSKGRQVRVLCRPTSSLNALPAEGVEFVFGDVADSTSVQQAMAGIEVLYHLAATTGGDWAAHYQGTVVGTQNVLQAAAEVGIRKVIYVSSLGVLHASCFPNNGVVDEAFPLEQHPEARGDYSRAKLEAERIARQFAEEGRLPVCIIRPGLVYGSGKAEFLSDAGFRVSNSLVLVVGLGARRLGLTHVENLVDALLLAEQSEDSRGRPYHIVDPDQPTVRQYIWAYRRNTGERLTALYIPTFVWSMGFGLLDRLLRLARHSSRNLRYRLCSITRGPQYDTNRAQKELGWVAGITFEEAMRRALASSPIQSSKEDA